MPYSEETISLARLLFPACHEVNQRVNAGTAQKASEVVKRTYESITGQLFDISMLRQLPLSASSAYASQSDKLLVLLRKMRADETST